MDKKMGGNYPVGIFEDFPHGEFRRLENYYPYAYSREEALQIALEYAKRKYPEREVSVISLN